MLILGIASVFVFVLSIAIGRAGITNPLKLMQAVLKKTEDYNQMLRILQNIRIPRALASFMVGACLSVAGLVYQTTFNNKLVSPDILGVSSGCCVGAGIAILMGMPAGMIRIMAFVIGFVAVSIAIFLPKLFRNHSALTLVLSGIIVGSFMDSFWDTGIVITSEDRCLQCFDLSFDVSVQGFLVPLTKGACCYTVPHGQIKYVYASGLIEDHQLTFGAMAPSMLRYLKPYFEEIDAHSMKTCIVTAEACPLELMETAKLTLTETTRR